MWIEFLLPTVMLIMVKCDSWEITFLGTGACFPTEKHALASTVLQLENGELLLFDAGEGTQLQLMKSSLKLTHIKHIFITHLHGDHIFGLPGLLLTIIAQHGPDAYSFAMKNTIHIYGPQGLRNYVLQSLLTAGTNFHFAFKVHEMLLPDISAQKRPAEILEIERVFKNNNILKGEDFQAVNYTYTLYKDDNITIYAARIKHKVPTYGFVVAEKDERGKMYLEKLGAWGVAPGSALFEKILNGETITTEEGKVIKPEAVLGPKIKGRKVTIVTDTCDPHGVTQLAMNSDVLIHEATFDDQEEDRAMDSMHSTPYMAARFAKRIWAKTLILNHFSHRYLPQSLAAYKAMKRMWRTTTYPKFADTEINEVIEEPKKCPHLKTALLENDAIYDLKRLQYNCTILIATELMQFRVQKNIPKKTALRRKMEKRYRKKIRKQRGFNI